MMHTPDSPPSKAAAALRAQAALLRRSAAISTAGGHGTNRLLMHVADKLDREADQAERTTAATRQPATQSLDKAEDGHE